MSLRDDPRLKIVVLCLATLLRRTLEAILYMARIIVFLTATGFIGDGASIYFYS